MIGNPRAKDGGVYAWRKAAPSAARRSLAGASARNVVLQAVVLAASVSAGDAAVRLMIRMALMTFVLVGMVNRHPPSSDGPRRGAGQPALSHNNPPPSQTLREFPPPSNNSRHAAGDRIGLPLAFDIVAPPLCDAPAVQRGWRRRAARIVTNGISECQGFPDRAVYLPFPMSMTESDSNSKGSPLRLRQRNDGGAS